MRKHIINNSILKECDIRGILDKDLTEDDAFFIGLSFGSHLRRIGKKQCITGYDARLSSPLLFSKAVEGLMESGVSVINIGLVPTPVVTFTVKNIFSGGGLMITASHNPPEYNGFKFMMDNGIFHDSDLIKLAEICRMGKFEDGAGSIINKDVIPEYIKYMSGFIKKRKNKPISIVWDPGNGAASVTVPLIIPHIPGNHTVICGDADGRFPNHHPDPSKKENLNMLKEAVISSKADLGIAFDGDGDRIGVVDNEGVPLTGDQLLTIFARDFLSTNPNRPVMSEVKASNLFYNEVTALGGRPVMWKVGHTNQKEKMESDNIKLAGETSGHIFFEENKGNDDALFSAIKLINILSSHDKRLSEIRKSLPVFHDTGEIRIPVEPAEQDRILYEILERLKKDKRDFIDIDGMRVSCKDGFWLIRKSNTEPLLTIRCEAATGKGLKNCMKDLQRQLDLSNFGINLFT